MPALLQLQHQAVVGAEQLGGGVVAELFDQGGGIAQVGEQQGAYLRRGERRGRVGVVRGVVDAVVGGAHGRIRARA